jgi:hypothetical protein
MINKKKLRITRCNVYRNAESNGGAKREAHVRVGVDFITAISNSEVLHALRGVHTHTSHEVRVLLDPSHGVLHSYPSTGCEVWLCHFLHKLLVHRVHRVSAAGR